MNTIIEKIRAEVERQARSIDTATGDFAEGRRMEQRIILSALSDLEKSEKPSEGFDGEFSKFSNDVDAEHPFPICVDEFKDFARHFYELGCRRTAEKYDEIEYKRQRAEESVPKDLEEAAKEYCPDYAYPFSPAILKTTIREAFIAGAKWQKEQMMDEWLKDRDGCFWDGVEEGKKAMEKEAVEVEVTETCGISSVWIKTKQFKPGQKVKIIIVKED